jgi:hypothetical protein
LLVAFNAVEIPDGGEALVRDRLLYATEMANSNMVKRQALIQLQRGQLVMPVPEFSFADANLTMIGTLQRSSRTATAPSPRPVLN